MKTKHLVQLAVAFALVPGACAVALAAESMSMPSVQTHGLGKPLPPGWEPAVHDSPIGAFATASKAEFRTGGQSDAFVLDAEGWVGGDYQRFWWKAEGEQETEGAKAGEIEVQALYGRLFTPFWDFQTGLRIDRNYSGRTRDTTGYFVLGVEGLAPYWFEIEPALFVSEKGQVSARFTATYDQLITQRWVIQPRIDLNAAFQDDTKRDVAAGLNNFEFGLRLRYDVSRQFGPYVGVTWRRVLGKTADLVRRGGEDISSASVVFGLRIWF